MKTKSLIALLVSIFALTACGAGTVSDGASDDGDASDALSTKGSFETFVGQDGRYYFDLVAGNGEKVLASQGYSSRTDAQAGINSVKTNGVDENKYELRTAVDGSPYFVLLAGNGAIIGVSELYASTSNANRAISTVISVVTATVATEVDPTAGARFTTFKGLDGKYYFNLRSANGEIVLQSQSYGTKASATTGVTSVRTNGLTTARYQVRAAADGESYFVLRAANNQVIGMSEMYASASNANAGITAVQNALTSGAK